MMKRKITAALTALGLTAAMITLPVNAAEAEISMDDTSVIGAEFYVSESGSDETGDGTQSNPYKTLMKASEAAGAENDAVFYVSGTSSWKTIDHTGLYTVIGEGKDSTTLNMDGEVKLNGPVTYRDLKFFNNGSADWGDHRLNGNKWFVTNGYDLTLEGEIDFGRNDGALNPTKRIEIGIGDTRDGERGQRVILKAGDIEKISLGYAFSSDSHPVTGPVYLRFTGDATSATQAQWGLYGGIYFGIPSDDIIPNLTDVDIVLDKAVPVKGNAMHAFTGTLQFISNNGAADNGTDAVLPTLDKEPEGGKYELYSPEGYYLDTTGEKGVFEVEDTTDTAYVVSADGYHVYYSVDNVLSIPEKGKYDVSYTSSLDPNTITLPEGATGWEDDGKGTLTAVAPGTENCIYVNSQSGSDENDGMSPDTAVATLEKAFILLNPEMEDLRIILTEDYTLRSDQDIVLPEHSVNVTVSGANDNVTLTYNNNIDINGPTTFERITLNSEAAGKFLNTKAYELIIGAGVTKSADSQPIGIHAGTQRGDGGHESLTINSGSFQNVYLGAFYSAPNVASKTAGLDFVMNGGNIGQLVLGADGFVDAHRGVIFTENVNITYNGGTISSIALVDKAERRPVFEKALQLICNNGKYAQLPEIDAAGGVWQMNCEESNGASLEATETAGIFKVTGGLTAVATDSAGETYVSDNGTLTVPAGTYNVFYTEDSDYTNNGEQIIFYRDTQLDLSSEPHTEHLGKLFVGWTEANGSAAANNEIYKAGTVLNAKYIDFDEDTDFAVNSAQFRTEESETPEGLRFIVGVSSRLQIEVTPREYGAVAIPLEIAGIEEPELGKIFLYNDTEYQTGSITADKLFSIDSSGLKYTMCITGLEGKYMRQYIVRGYMKYDDINGVEQTLYTDSLGANAYAAVKAELADDTITEERRAALESAFEKMEAERAVKRSEYMSQGRTDVVGSEDDKTGWKYRLDNGLMVREAEFDSGKGGDPVEIVQITDIHFNYCNDKDFAENNPAVMSTYENRVWNKNGASFGNALACMEYASFADKTVVTGDTLDYLSWGAIELMNRAVWDMDPGALIAMGNHEPKRQMQGTVADTATEEEIYGSLQSEWKHDINYTSQILNDKVMIVVMDNQNRLYRDSQYELLSADIEKARQLGIPILLFQHVAIPSHNPNEADLAAIYVGDTSKTVYNFYEGDAYLLKYGQGYEATDRVYDLIVNSGDVIKGIFCGDLHEDMYSEVIAKTANETDTVIPQYVLNGAAYDAGHVLKITVK